MENNERKSTALRLLGKLTEAHGAPGSEGGVRRVFREEVPGNFQTDGLGSIISEKRGGAEKPRIMLTGHMDEVGFVVQTITRSGLIKFASLGGWWAHTMPAKRVRILTQSGAEIIGVIGAKPPHFLAESERDKLMKIDDMFIDVGASDGDEVREQMGIRLGDSIVPESLFTPMHNPDLLMCKAFDNRVGMALTIHAMQMLQGMEHPNTVFGVGTVQEEVGIRGAQTAVHLVEPDIAIVLEGTPADDLPGTGEDERQGVLGKGVQVRIMDPSAILHRKFTRYAIETTERNNVRHQVAVRKNGGTDARAIHLHGSGVPTIVLGVPARYIHTQNGIININDYLSALDLVMMLLESLNADVVSGLREFDDQ
jgi:putative aminopeptidase FrvX